jgi:hypothetical protein
VKCSAALALAAAGCLCDQGFRGSCHYAPVSLLPPHPLRPPQSPVQCDVQGHMTGRVICAG